MQNSSPPQVHTALQKQLSLLTGGTKRWGDPSWEQHTRTHGFCTLAVSFSSASVAKLLILHTKPKERLLQSPIHSHFSRYLTIAWFMVQLFVCDFTGKRIRFIHPWNPHPLPILSFKTQHCSWLKKMLEVAWTYGGWRDGRVFTIGEKCVSTQVLRSHAHFRLSPFCLCGTERWKESRQ